MKYFLFICYLLIVATIHTQEVVDLGISGYFFSPFKMTAIKGAFDTLQNPHSKLSLTKLTNPLTGLLKKNIPQITRNKTHKGVELEFSNKQGNKMKWVEQNPKNISHSIEKAKNSSYSGSQVEGKVADFVRAKTEVSGFNLQIENLNGRIIAELDVITNKQIIEVKASTSSIDIDQIKRLSDSDEPNFVNYDNKEVILYIDKKIDITNKYIVNTLNEIRSLGVKVANSLEELEGILK